MFSGLKTPPTRTHVTLRTRPTTVRSSRSYAATSATGGCAHAGLPAEARRAGSRVTFQAPLRPPPGRIPETSSPARSTNRRRSSRSTAATVDGEPPSADTATPWRVATTTESSASAPVRATRTPSTLRTGATHIGTRVRLEGDRRAEPAGHQRDQQRRRITRRTPRHRA
jgi:hypothetical protein